MARFASVDGISPRLAEGSAVSVGVTTADSVGSLAHASCFH